MQATEKRRMDARLAAVDEHVRQENRHDLDGLLATFGANALYEDGPWGERHDGIYYDRATVLRQLGVLSEPMTLGGRLGMLLLHPATVVGAGMRSAFRRVTSRS